MANFAPDRMNTPGRRAAIERAKARAKAPPIVVVDTEGSGLYPDDGARVSVISWAYRDERGEIVSGALPFGQGPLGEMFDGPEDAGAEKWAETLEWLSKCRLVFHNAPHDLHELAAGAIPGYAGRNLIDAFYRDTSVVQRHLDPLELVGLEPSCVRRLGVEKWKWRVDAWKKKTKKRFDLIPWSVIEPYATEDAVNTLLLEEDQERRLEAGEGSREIIDGEHAVTRTLFRMEARGLGFDAAACLDAAHVLEVEMKAAEKALPEAMQPPTPARVCAYYYDHLGYKPTKLDKGELVRSADDFSRKGLRDQGAPFIDELDAWAKVETALTSWYQTWPERIGGDGRLRMRVRQTKVTSGRFSGERVNLLAIPHDRMLPACVPPIRSFIRPATGKRLFEVDLSQAEVRVGAVAVQSVALMNAYRAGFDVYEIAANDIFSVTRAHEEFDHYRGLCKRLVLATLYAAGAKTLSVQIKKFMGLDYDEETCQGFLDVFRAKYPEFKKAERRWMRYVERHGYVPLALDNRRYFQVYEQSYKALNQRVQGSVAVVMKPCMVEADETFPGVVLLQTHDSLLLETADETIPPRVARMMERRFTEVFRLPFIAEIKEWN